jgi:hypothetical protein
VPGYWTYDDGLYYRHPGYWGPVVGYYGGIAYGYGYPGTGYYGGYWRGRHFYYNQTVNNVNITNIHNVYTTTVVNNTTIVNRVSYNGGAGGNVGAPVCRGGSSGPPAARAANLCTNAARARSKHQPRLIGFRLRMGAFSGRVAFSG